MRILLSLGLVIGLALPAPAASVHAGSQFNQIKGATLSFSVNGHGLRVSQYRNGDSRSRKPWERARSPRINGDRQLNGRALRRAFRDCRRTIWNGRRWQAIYPERCLIRRGVLPR